MADTPMNEHTHPPEWWREQERIAGLTTATTLEPGESCSHVGCLSHTSHPCEGCGRTGGAVAPQKDIPDMSDYDPSTDRFAEFGAPGSPERHEFSLAMMKASIAAGEEWLKKPESERYKPKGPIWDVSWPTYIESWPNALHSLSVSSVRVQMTLEEARVMGSYIIELGEGFTEGVPENHETVKDHLIARLDKAVQQFPMGIFVRLGSRSPKDAFYWGCGLGEGVQLPNGQISSGRMAFDLLTCCSERIYDDLHMQIAMNYPPSVWIREGLDLPEWSEFRCFMQDRKLVGISQYYYRGVYSEITEDAAGIKWAIEQFFDKELRDASHLDSVVFDVFIKRRRSLSDSYNQYGVKLLEINPFYNLSDPCLFDWNRPEEFKGQIRFRTELGGHRSGVTDL